MRRLLALALALPLGLCAEAPQPTYDIVVYGGTSAAVIAAVQAKKLGKTVIVVSPDKHLGGLSSGGLGWTDSGDKSVIGGLSRDFYHRVWLEYQKPEAWRQEAKEKFGNKGQGTVAMDANERTMWIFEPSVAEKAFEGYVKDFGLTVERDEWLDRAHGVEKKDGRIVAITTLSHRRFAGRAFIDATYEGDLMAAAGVSYTVGREPNAAFDETLNGIQLAHAKSHQFTGKIDPYVVEGDPKSGLLPRIQDIPVGGPDGAGDRKIQAYNFRMCLTKAEGNRVPFPKPPGYDPKQYALLARTLHQGSAHVFGKFDLIPNAKTDTNNHGPFSTDNIGMNWDYPDASYERRREIVAEHRLYQQGYLYFLANDPSVPAKVRTAFAEWGLAKDEFTDNGNWPHQIYVREARRMTADVVVNENHLKRKIPTPRSVGMGSYNMDSHNVQRIVVKDADGKAYVRNEGDVQVNPGRPYPIDYGALVPKKAECTNLIVPVCVSCTHIAYGSIRMEPVFMILGQSAATAAGLALDRGVAVQDVPYAELSARLLADGQILDRTVPRSTRRAGKDLPGVTVDDADAKVTGTWTDSTAAASFVGGGYRHDGKGAHGLATATFETKLPKPGKYEVFLAIVPNANRATNAQVRVSHTHGVATIRVNLATPGTDGLRSLGTFEFEDTAQVVVSNEGADGFVVIDAVNWQAR